MVSGQTEHLALGTCNTQAQTGNPAQEEEEAVKQKHDLTKIGIEVLIDWVGITYQAFDVHKVMQFFGGSEFWPVMHGWQGYKQGYCDDSGNIKVWFDGPEGHGVNVQVSGKGCRQLEALGVVKDWVKWIGDHVVLGEFTRLDVAMDDRHVDPSKGLLQKDAIQGCIDEWRMVTRYKKCGIREEKARPRNGSKRAETIGWSRYFGSGLGETHMKTYDKVMEQGITEAYHWMRCELVARREKAQSLARAIVEHGLGGVASVIRGLLEFKEGEAPDLDGGRDYDEWETCSWWTAFLGEVEKVRLTVRPLVRTIEEVKNWLNRCVAPSLAAAAASHGGRALRDFIPRLLQEGERRLYQDGGKELKRRYANMLLPEDIAAMKRRRKFEDAARASEAASNRVNRARRVLVMQPGELAEEKVSQERARRLMLPSPA